VRGVVHGQALGADLLGAQQGEEFVEAAPLTAATDSRPSKAASRARTASAPSPTDIMPPEPDSSSAMAWERRATTRAPSARVSAPVAQAAAISPWEWPMTAAGVTP
jgi:hypothetical protein